MRDARRTTLIVRDTQPSSRAWNTSQEAASRVLFVKALSMLSFVLEHRSEDVDRLILDDAATADQFLDLLATLPRDFLGDVILARSGNTSFLSTASRAEGRLLYSMTATDLQFYLATLGLVATTVAIQAAIAA